MNVDVKNVVSKLNKLEKTLRSKIESGALINEVRRYADTKAKVLKQKVQHSKDLKKVVAVLDQRKKQFEKAAKGLPKEVKAVRSYLLSQRKELDKLGKGLLNRVKAAQGKKAPAKKAAARKSTTKKTAARRK